MKKLFIAVAAVFLTAGCQTNQENQYYYGNFNEVVYSHFEGIDFTIQEQVDMLVLTIEEAQSFNKPVAPGIHAHLGMLYFELGNRDSGIRHLEKEKQLFPESTHYIDFLIKNAQGV